mgnify:CR=1 FL=1
MGYHKLITELMFLDQVCNFRCDYCSAPLKPISVQNGVRTLVNGGKTVLLDASDGTQLGKKMRGHLEKARELEPTPILHLIGGELTLVHGITDFILEASEQYELIMLTTNGLLLDEQTIAQLSACKNLLLLFSLDGHTFDMNSYRIKSPQMNSRLVNNLETCIKYGIRVEVQTVLHDRNIKKIKEFADYLLPFALLGHYVKITPFPVRWTQGRIVLHNCDYTALSDMLEHYEHYQNVLPPQKYLSNLLDFLERGTRTTRCYVPYFVFGVDDRGRIKNCPCIPSICSSIDLSCDAVQRDIIKERESYQTKRVCSGLCNTCFEGWEIYNAYLQKTINKSELGQVAVGRLESCVGVLDDIRENIIYNDNYSHFTV